MQVQVQVQVQVRDHLRQRHLVAQLTSPLPWALLERSHPDLKMAPAQKLQHARQAGRRP